ncbi:MAG TPA: DUF6665 family protein [Steroidobacteraceae bacterium]
MNKGLESVEKEIAGEKAAALGQSGRKLQAALEKLRHFDEDGAGGHRGRDVPMARAKLLEGAGEALWAYIVPREAVGLIDADYVRREYSVPAEVWKHMKPKMAQAARERQPQGGGGDT